jgi:hypothetical protein
VNGHRQRLAAYLLVVIIGALGFWRVESTVDRVNDDAIRDKAQLCVTTWESREQIRRAIPIPAEALIEVVSDPPPATVNAYRAAVRRRIAETFPDPACDLAEARAQLDQ